MADVVHCWFEFWTWKLANNCRRLGGEMIAGHCSSAYSERVHVRVHGRLPHTTRASGTTQPAAQLAGIGSAESYAHTFFELVRARRLSTRGF